ncbi:hypothetical protein IWQ62_006661, partial [Dispira parvispora]
EANGVGSILPYTATPIPAPTKEIQGKKPKPPQSAASNKPRRIRAKSGQRNRTKSTANRRRPSEPIPVVYPQNSQSLSHPTLNAGQLVATHPGMLGVPAGVSYADLLMGSGVTSGDTSHGLISHAQLNSLNLMMLNSQMQSDPLSNQPHFVQPAVGHDHLSGSFISPAGLVTVPLPPNATNANIKSGSNTQGGTSTDFSVQFGTHPNP